MGKRLKNFDVFDSFIIHQTLSGGRDPRKNFFIWAIFFSGGQ